MTIPYTKINLLPYREYNDKLKQKRFIFNIIISAIMSILVSGLIYFILKLISFNQSSRINYLENELKQLSPQFQIYNNAVKENKVYKTLLYDLNQLVSGKYALYILLNNLNNFIPNKGMYITSISYLTKNSYKISGKISNNNLLTSFINHIHNSGIFKNITLATIKSNMPIGEQDFSITVDFK